VALALRIALTYGKSSTEERYDVVFEEQTYTVHPFATKAEAQQYFYNAQAQV
jgi:hypothetical protein